MTNPLLIKLETLAELSLDDRTLIDQIAINVRDFRAGEDIIREKDRPTHVHLIVEGWASRYQILENGRTRISAYLLPGDFCDTHITLLGCMDHNIAASMNSRVAIVSKDMMLALFDRPAIARALWWANLVDEGIMRAWIVNIGGRDAFSRVVHLMCELHARLCAVGMVTDDSFMVPFTQEQLGFALGLTAVHINRMLRQLRQQNLLTIENQRATIIDLAQMQHICAFDPGYLHLRDKR